MGDTLKNWNNQKLMFRPIYYIILYYILYIKHNRPDIIILNKQQKQAYLLDIAVPNSHNITQ
jgi:hypothetical protein